MPQIKKYDPDQECGKLVKRVKTICDTKGMTKYALAKAADVSKSTLHDLFTGKNKPYVHTLYKICNGLDITISELFTDHESTVPSKDTLSQEEKELVISYRYLPEEKKNNLKMYVAMLRQYQGKTKE